MEENLEYDKHIEGRMRPWLMVVIICLIGLGLALFWLIAVGAVMYLVNRWDDAYSIVYDRWYWIVFSAATVLSWLIEFLSYKALAIKARDKCVAEYVSLKRRIAGDASLSDTYERMMDMSYDKLSHLVINGLRNRRAYCRNLYRTREGLAVISVFMDEAPDFGDAESVDANAGFRDGVFPEEVASELSEFEFDLGDEWNR